MSTFLTWFLKEASVTELVMRILKFGEYYRTKISNTVFRIRVVFILGIVKLSEFLSL